MKIHYHKSFVKSYKKKDMKIRNKFKERLIIFMKNPHIRELNLHSLKWKYLWTKSINITGDYRAIFKEYPNGTYEFVEFIAIWTHSELY